MVGPTRNVEADSDETLWEKFLRLARDKLTDELSVEDLDRLTRMVKRVDEERRKTEPGGIHVVNIHIPGVCDDDKTR